MTESAELVYMNRRRVERTLKRMAYQISENNRKDRDILLLGIEERGSVIAHQLRTFLGDIYNREFPVIKIGENGLSEASLDTGMVSGSYPLVVDDVIFTGQTMFTALKKVYDKVEFDEIHTAVLIDRGHRSFPVQAQFVGMELSTKLREHVSVIVKEDHVDKVILEIS